MAVNAELAVVLTAKDRAGTPLRKLGKQVKDLGKAVDNTVKSANRLNPVLGAGAGGLAALAVTTGFAFNSFQEQAQLAFTTILKDGARAQKMVADIQEVAKVTPFDTESLTRASQRLLAFGVQADDVLPTLVDIADTVSGLGGGTEMIDRVTTAFGQMTAKGKAQAEELMQLAEAGIPVWKILADNIGEISPKLAEAAKSGKISQTQLIDQIQKLVSGGKLKAPQAIAMLRKGMAQQFGGLSKVQSTTAAGAASTFVDTLKQLLGDLTKGPFGETAGVLLKMADALDRLREYFKDLPDPIKSVVSWVSTFAFGIGAVVGGLMGANGLLGILGGGTGLTGVLGGLARFVTGASGPGAVLAGAFLVAKLAWDRNVQPIFDALGLYMTTFPHVKVGLDWANAQAKAVADWIMGLGPSISTAVKVAVQWANDAARDLASWANSAARSITQTVAVAVQWANDAARQLADWANSAARSVTQTVNVAVAWANDQAKTLADWANAAAKSVTQTVNVAVAWAGETAAAIGGWVQDAGATIVRTVETSLIWAGDTATTLGDWFEGKGEAIGRNVQTFLVWAGEVAGDLGGWFQGKGDAIGRNVSTFLNWAGDVAGTLGDWFLGRGDAIGRNVQTYLMWAGDLAGRIGGWVAGQGDALGRNISAYLGWAGDLASKIGGWLANGSNISRTIEVGFTFISDAARRFFNWLTGASGGSTGGTSAVPAGTSGGQNYAYATGGLALTPQLAVLGEAGPEAVIPLNRMGKLGGTTVVVNVYGNNYGFANFEDAVISAIDRGTRRGRL